MVPILEENPNDGGSKTQVLKRVLLGYEFGIWLEIVLIEISYQ